MNIFENNERCNAMNPRPVLLLILMILLTSCTAMPTAHKSLCDPGPRGNAKAIRIPVVFTPQEILKPEQSRVDCARPGDALVFMLNGRPDVEVSVTSDDADATWLNGSGKIFPGREDGWLWITVPASAKEGEFKYTIKAGSIVLDPAVRVRHSY